MVPADIHKELVASGIPYTSPQAVYKCALRINSGRALSAAHRYMQDQRRYCTFWGAMEPLNAMVSRLDRLTRQTLAEGR